MNIPLRKIWTRLGKKGINAKLASRLTKYKLDIKSVEEAKEIGIKVE